MSLRDPAFLTYADPHYRGYYATTTAAMAAIVNQKAGDTMLITRATAADSDHLWVCITGGTQLIANWRDTTVTYDTLYDHGGFSNDPVFDPARASIHLVTLNATSGPPYNNTPTFTPPPSGQLCASMEIRVKQPTSLLPQFMVWPNAASPTTGSPRVNWPLGQNPTLSVTASRLDRFTFSTIDGGVNWEGAMIGQGVR